MLLGLLLPNAVKVGEFIAMTCMGLASGRKREGTPMVNSNLKRSLAKSMRTILLQSTENPLLP